MDDYVRKIFTDACRAEGMSDGEMGAVEAIASTVVLSTLEHLTNVLVAYGEDLPRKQREICMGLVLDGMADGILEASKVASEVSSGA